MRKIALAAAALLFSAAAYSQQITRVAVVDLSRVITSYHSQSKAVRDFEAKKDKVQSDIDRMSAEIARLLGLKAESDAAKDEARSARLKSEIDDQTKKLSDYASIKQAELDAEAERLVSSDLFTQELYRKIQSVAEFTGGLTTSCSAPAAVASESNDGRGQKDKEPSVCGIPTARR